MTLPDHELRARADALSKMTDALAILDHLGLGIAAVHLAQAIAELDPAQD